MTDPYEPQPGSRPDLNKSPDPGGFPPPSYPTADPYAAQYPAAGPAYQAYPPQQYQQPGWPQQYPMGAVAPRTNGLAIAALICGLLSFLCLTSIAAVVLGHIARGQISKSNGTETGDGLALAGLILGYVFLAGWLIYWVVIVIVVVADGSSSY